MINEKVQELNLSLQKHNLIAHRLYQLNEKWIKDDTFTSFTDLLEEMKETIENGDLAFIYFIDNEPYGILYINFDRYNNAILHATTSENRNFYKNKRILKHFIQFLFEHIDKKYPGKKPVNKIKVELLTYDTNSEIACRAVGFIKEGILRDEITINNKPQDMIQLAMTRKDYNFIKNNPQTIRNNFINWFKKYHRKDKNE